LVYEKRGYYYSGTDREHSYFHNVTPRAHTPKEIADEALMSTL